VRCGDELCRALFGIKNNEVRQAGDDLRDVFGRWTIMLSFHYISRLSRQRIPSLEYRPVGIFAHLVVSSLTEDPTTMECPCNG